MSRKPFAIIFCAFLLLVTLACQFLTGSNVSVPPTSTPVEVVAAKEEVPTATATEDVAATSQALEESQKATEDAEIQAVTQAAAVEETQQAEQKLARTEAAQSQATEQADTMYQLVNKLEEEGVLKSSAGSYYPIDDFKESWAQLNWYQWWNTGYQPSDFVIRTHTAWESASRSANLFASGCGFVFRAKDVDNHYMIFLALDDYVYMKGYVDKKYRTFGKGYAGNINHIKGEADIVFIAQGDHFVYYVDGTKVFDKNNGDLKGGDLGLTLNSGTNKDYGTRCEMTNTELWILDE
jgi:hypothetical protein